METFFRVVDIFLFFFFCEFFSGGNPEEKEEKEELDPTACVVCEEPSDPLIDDRCLECHQLHIKDLEEYFRFQTRASGLASAEAQRLKSMLHESVISPKKRKTPAEVHDERLELSQDLIRNCTTLMIEIFKTEGSLPTLENLEKKHKASVRIPVSISRDDEKTKDKVSNLHKFAEGTMTSTNVCAFSIGKILHR